MHTLRRSIAAALAVVLVSGLAGPGALGTPRAAAQAVADAQAKPTAEDLARAKEAFTQGHALYKAKDHQGAIARFKEAYRLSRNPLLLYNIGFTFDELGQVDLALFYYGKFLAEAAPTAPQRQEVLTRVEALTRLQRASDAAAATPAPAEVTATTPAPPAAGATPSPKTETEVKAETKAGASAAGHGLMHQAITSAPPGIPLDITASIPDGARWTLHLFYRASGEIRFASTTMQSRYRELVGRIPAARTRGEAVQYYIEARDASGSVVARSGRSASPHLVLIETTARPRYYPDLELPGDEPVQVETPAEQPATQTDAGLLTRTRDQEDIDVGSLRFQLAKWGTTGTAAVLLGTSLGFYLGARGAAADLENEAALSMGEDCPSGPPCRAFSERQHDLERRGQRYQTISNITVSLGLVSAGLAGYLWYQELTRAGDRPTRAGRSLTAVPVVGRDVVGGAARLTF